MHQWICPFVIILGLSWQVLGHDQAIEPGFKPLDGRLARQPAAPVQKQAAKEEPFGFQLPSLGVHVSYKPDAAEQGGKGKKKEEEDQQPKPIVPTSRPPPQPARKTTTATTSSTSRPTSTKITATTATAKDDKQKREQEEKKKQEEEKKKKEAEAKKKQEEEKKKKDQVQKKPDSSDRKQPANKNNIGHNQKSIPKKYPVPLKNAGIAGVGGGVLPNQGGLAMEPGDLYQKAENNALVLHPCRAMTLAAIVLSLLILV